MAGLNLTLTTAGRQALVNAQNTGTNDLVISQIGVSAVHTAGDLTGLAILPNELKRLNTFAGEVVADDTLHLTIRDESADTYSLRKFGLYLSNGVLFAVFSQSGVILEKSAAAMLLLATDIVFADLTTANITFGATNFINPPATSNTPGVIEVADQAEVDAGIRNDVAVPPGRLKVLLNALLGGKANAVHTHDAADVVSGVLSVLRIPDLAMGKITGLVAALAGKSDTGHTHAAGDVVSGVFNVLRIPDLAISKITGLADALASKAAAAHTHVMADITGLVAALAGKLDRSNGNTHFDTSMSSTIGIVASFVATVSSWSRSISFAGDPAAATRLFIGAYGTQAGAGSPSYGYIAHGADGTSYGSADALRIYPGYAAWGTSPLWHAGNFDPATKANAAHQHAGEDIASGTVNDARLPTTMSSKTFNGPVRIASGVPTLEMAETDQANGVGRFMWIGNNGNLFLRRNTHVSGDFSTYATELTIDPNGIFSFRAAPKVGGADVWHPGNFDPATKAAAAHTHAAADIVSGIFDVLRIPDLAMAKITGLVAALAGKSDTGHVHAAADVTSGVFDVLRIPDLAMAKITGLAAALAGKANTAHTHAAADIVSGTLDVLRIPELAMAKITGLVDALAAKAAAIHTHAAADIVSGVLAVARIPDLAMSKITGLAAALTAATAAQFRGNTGTQPLQPSSVWSAAEIVNVVQAATLTIDMSTGINFSTTMTGNRTLGAPTNAKPGQSGILTITQDGTGFRTLTFDNAWKFAGGVKPALSGAAGARDVLCFTVVAAGDVVASLMKDVK